MADSRARSSNSRLAAALLLAAAVLLLATGLGRIDFWAPDEPRYGQVAEELRSFEHGLSGLALLHLGGEPYTQKPPLYYWLAASFGSVAGRVTESAARLPSALAGIATVLLTFGLARRLFPGPTALAPLLSGAVLLTSFRFAHLARRAQLDVLLALFETLAMYAFVRIERGAGPADRRLVALLHAALGAAALTKGPVGWLPLGIVAVYLAWDRRLGDLRQLVPAWSLLLSVAPVLAWIATATALAPAGFFDAAVVDNLLGRLVSADSHLRPFYYFLYQLPADFLPWTLLWPFVAIAAAREARAAQALPVSWRLLLCWVAVPLLFFSLASGKRGLYLLPAFPALALMIGGAAQSWILRSGELPAWIRHGSLAVAAAVVLAASTLAARGGLALEQMPGFGLSSAAAVGIAIAGTVGLAVALVLRRQRLPATALYACAAGALAIELVVFLQIYPEHDAEKSPRPIALEIAALTEANEPIGVFDDEGLAGGILYYGARKPVVLPRPRHVDAFLSGEGRFVVLERWKLPWLDSVGRFRVHAATRQDLRQLAVVSLEADTQLGP